MKFVFIILLAITLQPARSYGQDTTIIPSITKIPLKFITQTNHKIDNYTNRITNKTEKTLIKLANWENKIHKLLDKTAPKTAAQLFGEGKLTFASMLQKVQEGKSLAENTKACYNEYNDKLITNIKYIETQKSELNNKYLKPLATAKEKAKQLEKDVAKTETAEKLIKERKKELLTEAYKILGKNKYTNKIQQEIFYYSETLKNYKELFQDSKKVENVAFEILYKIPSAKEFLKNNGMLAGLFRSSIVNKSTNANDLTGLQTSAGVNAYIQSQISAGGLDASQQIKEKLQQAQSILAGMKNKALSTGGGSVDSEMPNFKPNLMKTKTFSQRLEYGTDISFSNNVNLLPSTMNIAFSIAYKLSSSKQFGIGLGYKAGLGSIEKIILTHEGLQFRTFGDMKLKKGFWFTCGWEVNQNTRFTNFNDLVQYNKFQQMALIGLQKKINFKVKILKASKISLLWDLLSKNHQPASEPFIIRYGYSF
jgi:hypothetical protein